MKKVKFLFTTLWLAAPGGPRKMQPGDIAEVAEGDTLSAWLGAGIVEIQ